jgi:hypothetical protein
MIELAAVIRDLRDELERAVVSGGGDVLRFELGPVELEVTVAVERSGQSGGKVRFWVVELGGQGTRDATDTQRIKLVLTPRLVGGEDRRVYVHGSAEPGER